MSEIRQLVYIDAVSTSTVQFRRMATTGEGHPSANPGLVLHQANIITGINAAANADTTFFKAGCTAAVYEVIIRKLGT